jgi:type II secretory pathway component PulF
MLALLMRAGLPYPRALELSIDAAGLEGVKARSAVSSALAGASFSETLGTLGIFAPTEMDALRTGELAGAYDRQLSTLATMTEERNEALLNTLAAILPPAIFIVVALAIAVMILRFYSRMFTGIMPGF